MRTRRIVAAVGCLSVTLAEVVDPESFVGPTVTSKNGTYGGIYLQNYNQDLFLGVGYAQVHLLLVVILTPWLIACRKLSVSQEQSRST